MADNVIEVAIRATTEELQAGMQRGQNIVRQSTAQMQQSFSTLSTTSSASFGSIASAATKVGTSSKAATTLAKEGLKETEVETRTLTLAVDRLSGEFREAGYSARDSMRAARAEMLEMRHASHLAAEEIGIKLPRALQGVIAKSEVLGPLMAQAFGLFAAIGFLEIAVQIGEKLGEFIADTFIFTEAEKRAYEEQVKLNQEIAKSVDHTKELAKEFALIGLHGAAKTKVEIEMANAELFKMRNHTDGLKGEMAELKKKADETFVAFQNPRTGQVVRQLTADAVAARAKIEALGIEFSKLTFASIPELEAKLKNLNKEFEFQHAEEGKKAVKDLMTTWSSEFKHMEASADAFRGMDLKKEEEFWTNKLKHASKGSELYKDVTDKINEIKKREATTALDITKAKLDVEIAATERNSSQRLALENKLADLLKKIDGTESVQFIAQQGKIAELTREMADARMKDILEADEEKLESQDMQLEQEQKHQESVLELRHITESATAKMHGATAAQLGAIDQAYEKSLLANTQTFLGQRRAIYEKFHALHPENPNAVKELTRLNGQLIDAQDKFEKASAQITAKTTADEQKKWDDLVKHIGQGFSKSMKGMLLEQKSFKDSAKQIGSEILSDFIDMGFQKLAHTKLIQGMMTALHLTAKAEEKTADAGAAAASIAASKVAAAQEIATQAAVGFAAAYASISAIPIIGPELAPGVAAGTYAAIMGAEGMGMAEQGAYLNEDMMILAHKNEMILPASLSSGMASMIADNKNGGHDDARKGRGGVSIGKLELHTIDAKSFGDRLEDHADQFVAMVKKKMRHGAL
jgi:hypothetical protein